MCITVCEADLAEKERKKQNQPKNQNEKKKKRKAESSQHASEYSNFFFFSRNPNRAVCQTHTVAILIVLSIFHFKAFNSTYIFLIELSSEK